MVGSRPLKERPWLAFDHLLAWGHAPMRQVALVAIDAIRNIVEILFLIWVQVLAPLKRVDRLKGFAKGDLITYRPRKINSAELRVGLRKDLGEEGHIATLRLFKVSSSLNPLEYLLALPSLQGSPQS
jgi:hypothetical protein